MVLAVWSGADWLVFYEVSIHFLQYRNGSTNFYDLLRPIPTYTEGPQIFKKIVIILSNIVVGSNFCREPNKNFRFRKRFLFGGKSINLRFVMYEKSFDVFSRFLKFFGLCFYTWKIVFIHENNHFFGVKPFSIIFWWN